METTDLTWRPDDSSLVPIFRQLTDYLRGQITAGLLPPDARLPPQRDLAAHLGVNRSTVVAAYAELQADGLVMGHTRGGTIVLAQGSHGDGTHGTYEWHDMIDRGSFVHDTALAAEVARARSLPGIGSLAQGELAPELRPAATLEDIFHTAPVTSESLGYEDMYGYRPLREAIAAHMASRGAPTDPNRVLILAGAQQGLYLICRGLLQPGDTVVVESPSHLLTLGILQTAGIRILRAPLDQNGLVPSRLEELLARQRVAMIFTTPAYQNPTGAVLATTRRARILDLCARYRVPLVEDDVYGELGFDGASPTPLYALDHRDYVIYVSSISKSVAPGLRVGWMISPPSVVKRLAEQKYQMQYGCSSVPQWVAYQWLDQGHHQTHLATVTRALQQRRDVLEDGLRRQFGSLLTWQSPPGGFHLWAQVHAPVTSTALFRAGLRAGIAIKPGSLYGVPARQAWIRLSFQHASLAELRAAPGLLRLAIDEAAHSAPELDGFSTEAAAM